MNEKEIRALIDELSEDFSIASANCQNLYNETGNPIFLHLKFSIDNMAEELSVVR